MADPITPERLAALKRTVSLGHGIPEPAVAAEVLIELEQQRADAKEWHDTYQDYAGAADQFLAELLDLLPGATDTGMDAHDQIPRGIEKVKAERDDAIKTRAVAEAEVSRLRHELERCNRELEAHRPVVRLAPGEVPALCPTCKQASCVPGLPGCATCVRERLDSAERAERAADSQVDLLRTELEQHRQTLMQAIGAPDLSWTILLNRTRTDYAALIRQRGDANEEAERLSAELDGVRRQRDYLHESLGKARKEAAGRKDHADRLSDVLTSARDRVRAEQNHLMQASGRTPGRVSKDLLEDASRRMRGLADQIEAATKAAPTADAEVSDA